LYRGKRPVVSQPQKNVGILFLFFFGGVLAIDVVMFSCRVRCCCVTKPIATFPPRGKSLSRHLSVEEESFFTLEWFLYHHHRSLLTSSADFLHIPLLLLPTYDEDSSSPKTKNTTVASKVLIETAHTHTQSCRSSRQFLLLGVPLTLSHDNWELCDAAYVICT